MALNSLSTVKIKLTLETAKQITQFLNYSASHPEAVIEYRRSGVVLHIYSGASYISEPEARNIVGVFFSFFLKSSNNTPITENPPENIPVHVECSIIRNNMSSATEAGLGGLFKNCQGQHPYGLS